jgi:sugar/nucleoside kinase (ribokinase family)
MKFLVLGHLCLDHIHTPDGNEIRSFGGIYYAVTALAVLAERSDRVIPVFGVGREDHAMLLKDLARFPAIDASGIYQLDEPTNQVHLSYRAGGTRTECSRHIAQPVPFDRIRPHLAVDGILVNMISGFDLTIETLDQIRMAVRSHGTPIHFDYHSLTLGVRDDHERVRRPLDDWRRWAFMTETVQLNEEEVAGLARDGMTELQTVGHLLTLGPKAVIVTRGERGASLFINEKKKVVRTDLPAVAVDRTVDATGCGDVFGAVFFQRYLRTHDMKAAAQAANRAAAVKARLAGSDRMMELQSESVAA